MLRQILKRVSNPACPHGTFGVLMPADAGVPYAVTLEPPWRGNERNHSCILPGPTEGPMHYICRRWKSPTFGTVFKIMDTPDREDVIFHWGNRLEDTRGCVLVAEEFGLLEGQPAVLTSRNAPGRGFNEFMLRLAGVDAFELIVMWA